MRTEAQWDALGLLEGLDGEGRPARLELLTRLEDAGFTEAEMLRAAERGDLPLMLADRTVGGPGRWTGREVARESGIDETLLRRIRQVSGLPDLGLDDPVYSDVEVESSRLVREFLDLGIPEETVLQVSRVMGRTLGTLAETTRDALVSSIVEQDMTELELAEVLDEATSAAIPLFESILSQVVRTHLRNAMTTQLVVQAGSRMPGTRHVVFAFADLVGFTRLGQEVLPEELGRVADRFDEMAGDIVSAPVRVTKTLGDGVMLVAPEAAELLVASLDLVAAADREGQSFPQVHVGIASGEALSRSGDWFGAPVNLASRISGAARAGSVVATRAVRDLAPDAVKWSNAGSRSFKGISGSVALYRARPLD